jgi:hypothetical protein
MARTAPGREDPAEIHFRYEARPWLTLQPNLQYIVSPGGYNNRHNITIVGLRSLLSFQPEHSAALLHNPGLPLGKSKLATIRRFSEQTMAAIDIQHSAHRQVLALRVPQIEQPGTAGGQQGFRRLRNRTVTTLLSGGHRQ